MAYRAVQMLRNVSPIARTALKQKCLNRKFVQPFTFEEAGPSNVMSPTIHTNSPTTTSPTTARHVISTAAAGVAAHDGANKSYATVTPTSASLGILADNPASTVSTLDNIVEQVESITEDVQKERGYHIVGKIKTSEDQLRKILAIGDMRVWQ